MNNQNAASALEQRVNQLEKQSCRLKLLFLGLPVVALMLGAGPEKDQPTDTVTAKKFVMTDSEGKPRASLLVENDISQLKLIDKDGNVGLKLVTGNGGAGLILLTEKNKVVAAFNNPIDTGPTLLLGDPDKPIVVIGGNRQYGIGFIDFHDGKGNWKAGYGGSALK